MDRQLCLELSDSPLRGRELCVLRRRETGLEPSVDSRLPPPRIDRLLANPEIRGDFRHLSTAFDQLDDTLPELGRVAPPCHIDLPSRLWQRSPVISLHETQGTAEPPGKPGRFIKEAKDRYGERIAILGGIDMGFLTRAKPAEVRERVRETLEHCQPGGGYCLGTGNTVANYIPVDNYLAMLDEGRSFSS